MVDGHASPRKAIHEAHEVLLEEVQALFKVDGYPEQTGVWHVWN